jgi:gliding motility-associated-like protein
LVILSDTLPAGVQYKSATASIGEVSFDIAENAVILEIDEILPGDIITLEIEVTAESIADITNIAQVVSNEKDSNPVDNTATVSHRQMEFSIPNAFSPNGDGINEEWIVKGLLDIYPNNRLVIVNRWGVEIFRASNYQNDWNGQGVGEGTYFYQLTLTTQDGQEEVFTGYLTVIK